MDQDERLSFTAKMMPWLAVFAFLLLSMYMRAFDGLVIEFALFTVPLAIFLGHRYGRNGVRVVLLSGLFMVPTVNFTDYWFIGVGFDLWIVSIFACHLAASERTLEQLLPKAPFSLPMLAVFLVFPIWIGVWGIEFDSDIVLKFKFGFTYLAFIFLFVAGLARSNTYHIISLLVIVMMIGLILRVLGLPYSAEDFFSAQRAELPLLGWTELSYTYIAYGSHNATWIFTGLAYFATGRVCNSMIHSSSQPPKLVAVGLLSAIAILAAGVIPFDWLTVTIERGLDSINTLFFPVEEVVKTTDPFEITVTARRLYFRAYPFPHLYPLLGFASALLFAYRGVISLMAGMTLLWIANALFRGYFPGINIPYHLVLVILGFAALGILLRNRLLGTTDRWWSRSWAVYLLIVVVMTAAEGVSLLSVYFPMVLAISIALGLGAQRLRLHLHGRKLNPNGGWVALIIVLGLPYTLWSSLGYMAGVIKQLAAAATIGEMLDDFDDQWWVIALLAIFALWMFLTAVKVLIAKTPACINDLRRLRVAVIALVTRTPLPPDPEQIPTVKEEARWWYPQALIGLLIKGTKWTGILLAIGAFSRPTIDYIGELEERRIRQEQRDLKKREMKTGELKTLKVTVQKPDPYQLQATLEALADWNDVQQEPYYDGVRVKTGWSIETAHPDDRKRASVSLRYSRDKPNPKAYMSVYVKIQRKSRGVWVETRDLSKRQREATNELNDQLKQRVEELAEQR